MSILNNEGINNKKNVIKLVAKENKTEAEENLVQECHNIKFFSRIMVLVAVAVLIILLTLFFVDSEKNITILILSLVLPIAIILIGIVVMCVRLNKTLSIWNLYGSPENMTPDRVRRVEIAKQRLRKVDVICTITCLGYLVIFAVFGIKIVTVIPYILIVLKCLIEIDDAKVEVKRQAIDWYIDKHEILCPRCKQIVSYYFGPEEFASCSNCGENVRLPGYAHQQNPIK